MVIAVVGSGGKTTLIKRLAKEYLEQNKSVLVVTSTHMYREENTLVTDDANVIIEELREKKFCHAGRPCKGEDNPNIGEQEGTFFWQQQREKITALSNRTYEAVCYYADIVLVEADGSRHLPLKFPNKQEPVIYENVDEIIVVYGLHGLGEKIKDVVHRWELAQETFENQKEFSNSLQQVSWHGEEKVTCDHIQFLLQKGYIEPLKEQYPNKKISLYGACVDSLYERVIASVINYNERMTEANSDEGNCYDNIEVKNILSLIKEEWFKPQPKLIILGGGHVSVKLARMAAELDFQVKVMDDREEFANEERFLTAYEVICDSFENIEKYLEPEAYYVVVTRGHKDDFECVKKILPTKYAYLGMIGSQLKVEKTLENLEKEGFTREQLATIFAPIGLKIHAINPGEIAISILAQIIQEKNKKQVSSASCELLDSKESGVLCIIVEKSGSSPRGVGSMMLVTKERVIDSIGGGAVEFAAIDDARSCKEVMIKEYHLNNKDSERLGMICGGSNKVLFVPV